MDAMELIYIRHAQSANNALFASNGSEKGRSEDPDLTGLGIRQAQALANFLLHGDPKNTSEPGDEMHRGVGINYLYSSPMLRAVSTGTIISQTLHIPLRGWIDLHERGGIYLEGEEGQAPRLLAGKNRKYFQEKFPEFILPPDFIESGWWNNRPMEKPEEYGPRARRFLKALLERHGNSEDHVAVISHAGFYVDLLGAILKLPDTNGIWFTLSNAAISRIDFHKDLVELVYQNRRDYLPGNMIT